MELRDIEYFAVIAQHGNVRRASEALGLSPPALSKSLRRLEKSLQAKLIERTTKGVALTAVGSALLSQVQRIRVTLDDVAREAADLTKGRTGHLRIGVGPGIVEDFPAAYAALVKEAPKLTMHIMVAENDLTVPLLCKGELDLIFNILWPSPHEETVQDRLFDDVWVACASAAHPLARKKHVTIADLVQERWVSSAPTVRQVQWVHRAFSDRGLPPPRVAVETRPVRLRLQICAASDLISFFSRRTLRQVAPSFRLKELPVKELTWRRPVGVIYRKDAYLAPAALRFIEILKSMAKEIAAEKP